MYSKMARNITADSYDACEQEIQPFFEIKVFIFTHNLHLNIIFAYGNHLKECHLWLILKGISQNTAFHLFSRSNTFWTP